MELPLVLYKHLRCAQLLVFVCVIEKAVMIHQKLLETNGQGWVNDYSMLLGTSILGRKDGTCWWTLKQVMITRQQENNEIVCQLLFEDSHFMLDKLAYRLLTTVVECQLPGLFMMSCTIAKFLHAGPPTLDRRSQKQELSHCDLFWKTAKEKGDDICTHRY